MIHDNRDRLATLSLMLDGLAYRGDLAEPTDSASRRHPR
jgi:hypothetical protein